MRAFVFAVLAMGFSDLVMAASPIVPGQYAGRGSWRDAQGHSGTYEVSTNVTPLRFESSYQWDKKQNRVFNVSLSTDSEGFYELRSDEGLNGGMYCYDVQCHLSMSQGEVEETLTFWDGNLYKLGSKKLGDGRVIMWQEDLQLSTSSR